MFDILVYNKEVRHGEVVYATYESAWEAGRKAIRRHFASDLTHGSKAGSEDQAGGSIKTQGASENEIVWSPS